MNALTFWTKHSKEKENSESNVLNYLIVGQQKLEKSDFKNQGWCFLQREQNISLNDWKYWKIGIPL